jgi:hypothetical protein
VRPAPAPLRERRILARERCGYRRAQGFVPYSLPWRTPRSLER